MRGGQDQWLVDWQRRAPERGSGSRRDSHLPSSCSSLECSNASVVKAKPEDPRLSVKLNDERTCVDLEISSAEVADSALYYYAWSPSDRKPRHTIQNRNENTEPPLREKCSLLGAPDLDPRLSVKQNDEKNRVDLEISF
ncbi:unnamed protein product [Coregonus sp. 'balchen']|nr:unnamed protein product [Coregonus sp. 'balchen']